MGQVATKDIPTTTLLFETFNGTAQTIDLTCKICSDVYKDPKILPCLDTFCMKCIQKLCNESTSKKVTCPVCKMQLFRRENKLCRFDTNMYYFNLLQVLKTKVVEKLICQVCSAFGNQNIATKKCLECSDFLCYTCAKSHTFTKYTISHTVVTLEDLKHGKYDSRVRHIQKMMCPYHASEEMYYFCQPCSMAICRECMLAEHKGHTHTELPDALDNCMYSLQQLVLEVEKRYETLQGELIKEESFKKHLQDHESKFMQEIIEKADDMVSTVVKEKTEALKEVGDSFALPIKDRVQKIQQLKHVISIMNNSIKFCKTVLHHGKDIEILSLEKSLRQQLLRLQNYDEISQAQNTNLPITAVTFKDLKENDKWEKGIFTFTYTNGSISDLNVENESASDCSVLTKIKSTQTELPVKPSVASSGNVATQTVSCRKCNKSTQTNRVKSMDVKVNLDFSHLPEKYTIPLHSNDDTRIPCANVVSKYGDETLIIHDNNNKTMKTIDLKGEIKRIYRLDKITPSYITVCGDTIVVSDSSKVVFMCKNNTWQNYIPVQSVNRVSIPLTSFGERCVVAGNVDYSHSLPLTVFTQKGDHIKNIYLNEALPIHLTANSSGQIIISDWSKSAIRIVNLENGAEIACINAPTECGIRKWNKDHRKDLSRWRPGSLATDLKDNIFVADYDRGVVVTLDKDGKFVKETLTDAKSNGIGKPYYLASDSNQRIFILGKQRDIAHVYNTSKFLTVENTVV